MHLHLIDIHKLINKHQLIALVMGICIVIPFMTLFFMSLHYFLLCFIYMLLVDVFLWLSVTYVVDHEPKFNKGQKICPNCKHLNDANAQFCNKCGHEFTSGGAQFFSKAPTWIAIVALLFLGGGLVQTSQYLTSRLPNHNYNFKSKVTFTYYEDEDTGETSFNNNDSDMQDDNVQQKSKSARAHSLIHIGTNHRLSLMNNMSRSKFYGGSTSKILGHRLGNIDIKGCYLYIPKHSKDDVYLGTKSGKSKADYRLFQHANGKYTFDLTRVGYKGHWHTTPSYFDNNITLQHKALL